jgi:hypothetical protein
MRKLLAVLGALLMLLVACHDGSNYHPTYVVGDSIMRQVEDITGHGSTTPGCGYTGENGWPFPCTINLEPPDLSPIVMGVSVWDVGASDLSAYTDAHEYYSSFDVPVIWVEFVEVTALGWTAESIEQHNADVGAELGCDLVDWSIRDPGTYTTDGIHYTSTGAQIVAIKLSTLTEAEACV